jgi:hypothetical protein
MYATYISNIILWEYVMKYKAMYNVAVCTALILQKFRLFAYATRPINVVTAKIALLKYNLIISIFHLFSLFGTITAVKFNLA